jgi:hypothetical protein
MVTPTDQVPHGVKYSLTLNMEKSIQNLDEFDFGSVEKTGISRNHIPNHNKEDCCGGLLRGNELGANYGERLTSRDVCLKYSSN